MPKASLLFIPGLMSDETAWADVADTFRMTRNVVIADVSPGGTMAAMAQHILERVEGDIIPIGHSMGGRIALEIQRLAPERVKAMVLADTGVHPLSEGELAKREAVIALAHEKGMDALADQWLPPMVAKARHADTPFMTALRDMMHRAGPNVHERQIQALIARPDARAQLEDIACPVFLFAGEEDAWSPPARHEDMAKILPNASVKTIADAGHFAPAEQPEIVAGHIKDWLEANGL